ncbi:MAG: ABC transporter permease [Mycobacterium sp.]|nr:ABC transporter permease [Mycobacterium sp.]
MRTLLSRLRLLNVRYLRGHPARTLLSVGVIACSAALIVAVLGTYGSVSGSANRLAEQVAGNAALEITGITDAGLEDSLVATVERTDGVKAAVPLVQTPILVAGKRVMLFGTDERAGTLSSSLRHTIDDIPQDRVAAPGLWVGPAVTGVTQGHPAQVVSMTGNATEVPIAGVIPGENAQVINRGNIVIARLEFAQRLTGRPGRLDSVLVVAKTGADVSALRQRLSERLDGRAYVATPSFRAALASSSTTMAQNVTLLVAMLGLVVAAFLVFNTMNMAANERRTEMATLRALGARRAMIMRDFVAESFLIGLVGAAMGSVVGVAMAAAAVSRLPPLLLTVVDAEVEFVLPPSAIAIAVMACVGASLLASWLAAYRVSRVQPVVAMLPLDETNVAPSASGSRLTIGRTWGALGAGCVAIATGIAVSFAYSDNRAFGGTVLLLVGVVLVALAAARPITRAVAHVSGRLGAPGHLAAASAERVPQRTWATTMTVCLAMAIGVATTGSSQNIVAAAGDAVSTLKRMDFVVQSTPGDEFPFRQLLPAQMGQEIQRVAGVQRVLPSQFTYAYLPAGRALVQGLSGPSNSPAYQLASDTARRALLDGSGAVVSRLFAKQYGLHVGDTLTLPTPTGTKHLRVADIIDFLSADAGLVAISLDELEHWFSRFGASFYEVILAQGADHAQVQAALDRIAKHAPFPVYVLTGSKLVASTKSAVQQVGALATALQWIVALVGGLALLNTLMLAVVERRRELGILRALGARRKFIGRLILADAVGVSAVGGFVGLALGFALQYVAVVVLGKAGSLSVPFAFVPLVAAMAIGSIFVTLAGALPPARTASRLKVVEAIGYE